VFFYKALFRWEMVPIHYFALFLSFSAALSLDWMLRKRSEEKIGAALGWSLTLLIFIGMLALSAVRIQWLVLPVLLIMVWIEHLRSDRRLALPGVLLLLFSVAAFTLSPSVRKRLQESLVEWQARNDKMDGFQTNERYYLWSHGTAMIAERIVSLIQVQGSDRSTRTIVPLGLPAQFHHRIHAPKTGRPFLFLFLLCLADRLSGSRRSWSGDQCATPERTLSIDRQ
ncbi:MAG: hypothetical protein EBS81_11935, partial [Gammaproteobacteria bacterium]|nr:hypothetical protein [Gammaproteobacteria bacterium]